MIAMLWGLAALAETPRDRPDEVRPKLRWDVTHLELDLTLDPDAGRVEGTTTHHIAPLLDHQVFRLHAEALTIGAVTVDGTAVQPREGDGFIDVPVTPGAPHVVTVAYSAEPELGMFFRSPERGHGYTEIWTQGEGEDNRFWFPAWDYPNDLFTLSSTIRAPKGLVVRSNGKLEGVVDAGAHDAWSFKLEQPLTNYLVALVAGEYQVLTEEIGGVTTEILAGKGERPETLELNVGQIPEMLAYYTDLLGPYPFPAYRQALVQGFLYGGMENTTLTVLTAERLADPGQEARAARMEYIVAHELAHHWFGDQLTCFGWRELWLNEGFTTYYEQRWNAHANGPEYAAAARKRNRERALAVTNPLAARAHTKVADKKNAGVYIKGSSVLHALAVYIGQDRFDAMIKDWVARHQHTLVESEQFRIHAEKHTGESLAWLFDQWVFGREIPTWKTRWRHADGQLELTVTAEGDVAFHTPFEIEIGSDPVRTERIWLDGETTRLVVPLDDAPAWVAIDPQGGVLGAFDVTQADAQWLAQLTHSPSPLARLNAIDALAGSDHPGALEAVHAVAVSDADSYYRRTAVEALGEFGALPVDTLLRPLLASDNAYLREAAVKAYTDHESPAARKALTVVLQQDSDPYARAAALEVLTRWDPEQDVDRLRRRLDRPDRSRTGAEHQTALELLGERGTLKDGEAIVRFTRLRSPRWVRVQAAYALQQILGRAKDSIRKSELADRVSSALSRMLEDSDHRVRMAAIRSFATLPPAEQAPLRRFASTTTVPSEARAADKVLRPIPTGEDDETPDEAARIDALENAVRSAEERLESLEEWRR